MLGEPGGIVGMEVFIESSWEELQAKEPIPRVGDWEKIPHVVHTSTLGPFRDEPPPSPSTVRTEHRSLWFNLSLMLFIVTFNYISLYAGVL